VVRIQPASRRRPSNVIRGMKLQGVNGRLGFAPLVFRERNRNGPRLDRFTTTTATTTTTTTEVPPVAEEVFLGLPELPELEETNDIGADDLFIDGDEEDKLQLLPHKEASDSVARFHKDPERAHDQIRVEPEHPVAPAPAPPSGFLQPPSPPLSPVQFVGQVLSQRQLKSLPDSPVVRIRTGKRISGGFQVAPAPRPPSLTQTPSAAESRARSNDDEEESGLRLPVQLRSPGEGLPSPLIWISPASLARSPMVSLRRLRQEVPDEANEVPLERALTMAFPAERRSVFRADCIRCLTDRANGEHDRGCPQCLAAILK